MTAASPSWPPALLLVALLVLVAHPCIAEDWDLSVSAGSVSENVYVGSDDLYVAPLVSFDARRRVGPVTTVFSLLEGISVSYVHARTGLMGSLTVNQGDERKRDEYSTSGIRIEHSDRTARLLAGTPNISTPVTIRASLDTVTPVGMVGISVEHHPTRLESADADVADELAHGLLYSLHYMVGLPLTERLSFGGMLGLTFMSESYADAWFTVEQPTEALTSFEAGAGARDAQLAVQFAYAMSPSIDMVLTYANLRLLGDAQRSPYTLESAQHTVMLQAVYGF